MPDTRFDNLIITPQTPQIPHEHIEEHKTEYRHIIRNNPHQCPKLTEHLVSMIQKVQVMEDASSVYALASIVFDVLTQAIIYYQVTLPQLSQEKRHKELDVVEAQLQTIFTQVSQEKPILYTCHPIAMPLFVGFLKFRNRHGHFSEVRAILEEEQTEEAEYFQDSPPSFSVEKWELFDEENLKQLFMEGSGRCDNFGDKLKQTKELVQLLRIYNRRNVSEDRLLDLKVIFRELYLSKSKFKVSALTIARHLCNDSFSESQYRFLNEKISRGYFRERNPLEFYNRKNQLQDLLYRIIMEQFLYYDVNRSCEVLTSLVTTVLPTVYKTYLDACEEL